MTPLRPKHADMATPGSTWSAFSPFSPNFESAMMQGMTMTPHIVGTGQALTEPTSWEAHDARILKETLNFGETPNRKLDSFLESTGSSLKFPSTEEMNRTKPVIPDLDSKPPAVSQDENDQVINVSDMERIYYYH